VRFHVKWPKRIIRDEIRLLMSVAIQHWTLRVHRTLQPSKVLLHLTFLGFPFTLVHKHDRADRVCLFLSISSDVSHSELCQISTLNFVLRI